MKTRILNIALSVILALIVSNVYADGTKGHKKNSSTREKAEIVKNRLDNAFETELKVENWMTEVNEFNTAEVFTEEDVKLEKWMMEEFKIDHSEMNFDAEIELESWMKDSRGFDEKFVDEEIQLQSWMLEIF